MKTGRMLIGLIALALTSGVATADRIELRTAARIQASKGVTLGDVARLDGPHAERIAGIVLLAPGQADLGSPVAIEVGQVREALSEAGVNWAMFTLRGGRCDLLPAAPPAQTPALPPKVAAPDPDVPTVRTVVERRLRETFGVADEDAIRCKFEDRDAELLSSPLTQEGKAPLLVEAHTTGSSSRVPVSVSVYRGDSLVESRQIRVDVEILRDVCVVRAPVERRGTIREDDLVVEKRWLTPDVAPAAMVDSVGAEATTKLEPGEVLTQAHVVPPVVINRGEQVLVHYLSGPVILKTKARALEDGRVGDRIRLEVLGSKRRLEARVDGPGRAVVRNEPTTPGVLEDETPEGVGAASVAGVQITRSE
ncbi:MAG: flagellar basal body P-ring formation chaperone FlgA [Phycisphaerales bacterium]